MDNFNIDKNTVDKLNSMINNGNLNDMLSQISPESLKSLSNMLNNNTNNSNNNGNNSNNSNSNSNSNSNANSSNTSNNNFDFSNIDINTMMKMKSILDKMNNSSDPRSNLLNSLKPYLRDSKKNKLDQYSQFINMSNVIELFNQNNKENSGDK